MRRAGLASYTELCETAGLKVPFEDGSIKNVYLEGEYGGFAIHIMQK